MVYIYMILWFCQPQLSLIIRYLHPLSVFLLTVYSWDGGHQAETSFTSTSWDPGAFPTYPSGRG